MAGRDLDSQTRDAGRESLPEILLMPRQLVKRAGKAVVWKGVQLAGTKLLFLARILILARLLVPDDFGLMAVALIPIGVLVSVTDLGLIPALVQLPKVESRHYDAAWTAGLLRALAIAVLVILTAPWVAELAGDPRATSIIRVLGVHPLLEALASIKTANLIRELDFRSLTWIRLSQALFNTLVAIVLAPSMGVWALVAGTLAGSAAYALASYLAAPHVPRFVLDRTAASRLVRFGRWILVTSVLAVVSTAILKMIISRRLGTAELGLYFLAARLAFLPAEIAGEISSSVAFPIFSEVQSNVREAVRAFRGVLTSLLALLTPITLLLVALAPALQVHILGPKWIGTVPAIRVLALAALLGMLGEVAIPLFQGLGEPFRMAILEGAQALLLATLAWWLTGELGLMGAALAWVPAIGASQVICAVFLLRLLPKPFTKLGPRLTAIGLTSAAGAVIAGSLSVSWQSVAGFLGAAAIGTGVTMALLWLADRRLELRLLDDLVRLYPGLASWLPVASVSRRQEG